jgi:hypothetical protein
MIRRMRRRSKFLWTLLKRVGDEVGNDEDAVDDRSCSGFRTAFHLHPLDI